MASTLFTQAQIEERINNLAQEIARDYKGKECLFISVLNGAFIFTADLLRALWLVGMTDTLVDFIGISSYGENRQSSQKPQITKDITINVSGKEVVIIEDIIETGHSLKILTALLLERGAKSVQSIVFLDKPGKREVEFIPTYTGFSVPDNAWIEGYGLDTKYKGRGNPTIIIRE